MQESCKSRESISLLLLKVSGERSEGKCGPLINEQIGWILAQNSVSLLCDQLFRDMKRV